MQCAYSSATASYVPTVTSPCPSKHQRSDRSRGNAEVAPITAKGHLCFSYRETRLWGGRPPGRPGYVNARGLSH